MAWNFASHIEYHLQASMLDPGSNWVSLKYSKILNEIFNIYNPCVMVIAGFVFEQLPE